MPPQLEVRLSCPDRQRLQPTAGCARRHSGTPAKPANPESWGERISGFRVRAIVARPGMTMLVLCGKRLFLRALRQRENLDAVLRDADRMLELRRQRAVAGHRGPAVRQDLYVRLAEIDHR